MLKVIVFEFLFMVDCSIFDNFIVYYQVSSQLIKMNYLLHCIILMYIISLVIGPTFRIYPGTRLYSPYQQARMLMDLVFFRCCNNGCNIICLGHGPLSSLPQSNSCKKISPFQTQKARLPFIRLSDSVGEIHAPLEDETHMIWVRPIRRAKLIFPVSQLLLSGSYA